MAIILGSVKLNISFSYFYLLLIRHWLLATSYTILIRSCLKQCTQAVCWFAMGARGAVLSLAVSMKGMKRAKHSSWCQNPCRMCVALHTPRQGWCMSGSTAVRFPLWLRCPSLEQEVIEQVNTSMQKKLCLWPSVSLRPKLCSFRLTPQLSRGAFGVVAAVVSKWAALLWQFLIAPQEKLVTPAKAAVLSYSLSLFNWHESFFWIKCSHKAAVAVLVSQAIDQ